MPSILPFIASFGNLCRKKHTLDCCQLKQPNSATARDEPSTKLIVSLAIVISSFGGTECGRGSKDGPLRCWTNSEELTKSPGGDPPSPTARRSGSLLQFELEMQLRQAERVLQSIEDLFRLGGKSPMPVVACQSRDERFLPCYMTLSFRHMSARLRNGVFGRSLLQWTLSAFRCIAGSLVIQKQFPISW